MSNNSELSPFANSIFQQKYSKDGESWSGTAKRVVQSVLQSPEVRAVTTVADKDLIELERLITNRQFLPGGRYLYAAGRDFHQVNNCLLMRAEDSREGWADLMQKVTMALMTGAGVGVDYSAVRSEGSIIRRTGGTSTGPLALMQMVNEAGRHIMQGGARRSALWAGLNWNHPDVMKFIAIKDWSDEIKKIKEKDFNAYAPLDGTNISVILDKHFFDSYDRGDPHAHRVFTSVVSQMCRTGEPGFSVDYDDATESLRNACTEITSSDDSDVCNLGSLNLARFDSIEEFKEAVKLGTMFLMAGTLYSHIPYEKVRDIRNKNRRLGLGIMGVHEWLLKRGKQYGPDKELETWLEVYRSESRKAADEIADSWAISKPIKVRAIAPTGTIGIVAETTTGIEPIFCVAYRRRYKGPNGTDTLYQYVVDPTAKRLLESGIDEKLIEDSYTLAEDIERRLAFQAWVQQFVDHGISSTINMPAWGSDLNNAEDLPEFKKILYRHLDSIRGITVYPDGARGGQPLVRVNLSTALGKEGQVFVEQADQCDLFGSGTCGS